MNLNICLRCNKSFKGKRPDTKFCSLACYESAKAAEAVQRRTRLCAACNQTFVRGKEANQRYCSLSCYWKSKVIVSKRTCDDCGRPYQPRPERANRGFCSQQCAINYRSKHHPEYHYICKQCGKNYTRRRKESGRKFCSHLCYAKSREVEFHSPSCRREFTPKEKRLIKERDGNRCVQCGSADRLCVDHKIACVFGGSHSIDNGQTLCHKCHSVKTAQEQRLNWQTRRRQLKLTLREDKIIHAPL